MNRVRPMILTILVGLLAAGVAMAAEVTAVGVGATREAAIADALDRVIKVFLLDRHPEVFNRQAAGVGDLVHRHRSEWVAEQRVVREFERDGGWEVYLRVRLAEQTIAAALDKELPPDPDRYPGWGDLPAEFSETRVITRDDILASGARNLADLFLFLPGMRPARDRQEALPAPGAGVSGEQFSRLLLMMDGHVLNKSWNGGADQEWSTGFLENLREIRVYYGPQSVMFGAGGMEMAIDFVTLGGADLAGDVQLAVSGSVNADRFDRFDMEAGYGDTFGGDGAFAVSGGYASQGGQDARDVEDGGWYSEGDRLNRMDPSFQFLARLEKGPWRFSSRFLQHHVRQPDNCEKRWQYVFGDLARTVALSAEWRLELQGGVDYIDTRWGDFNLSPAGTLTARTSVAERRAQAAARVIRQTDRTKVVLEASYRNDEVNAGPSVASNDTGFMETGTNAGFFSGTAAAAGHLTRHWSLLGAVRLEKSSYYDVEVLPEAALRYRREGTTFLARYTHGLKYEDTWWRVGSGNYNAWLTPAYVPYVVPNHVSPELNRQLRLHLDQRLGGGWNGQVSVFWGGYDHLQGLDWDYALANLYERIRVADLGGYEYWGAQGALIYASPSLCAEVNLAWHRPFDLDLDPRQLYVNPAEEQVLYLSPVVANFLARWRPHRNVSLSAGLNVLSGAANGGLDYESAGLLPVYDTVAMPDTGTNCRLDFSLLFSRLWQDLELQLSGQSILNQSGRLPLVGGGFYHQPGFEIEFLLRKLF